MANVNTIKTRILNKYDELANYQNFTPLKGEVCIAVIGEEATTNKGLKGDTSKKPIVGIKVGDGTNSFNNLPWIQAVAGDVSTFVKGITDADKFNELVNALITNAKLASAETLAGVDKRLQDAEKDIDDLEAVVLTGDNSNANLRAAINAVLGSASDTSEKNTIHGAKKYAEEKASAAQTAAQGYADGKFEEKGVAAGLVSALETGKVKGNSEAIAGINAKIGEVAYTGNSMTEAIKALQDSVGDSSEGLGSQVTDLKTRMGAAETAIGTKAAQADLTTLQGRVTTVENDLNAATTGLKAKVTAVEGKLTDIDTTVVAKINASEEATNAKIKAITDDYLKAADKQALQTQIDTIMSNPDAEGAINSINEFTQYVKDHGEIAEGFRTDINGLKEKVDTGNLTVSAYVSQALEDSNLDQYATAEALAGVDKRVKDIEDAPYATTANVATAKSEVIGASGDTKTADTIYGAKAYADDVAATTKSQAISEAGSAADKKYELKNVAKGLVDALAGEGNTSTVKGNAEEIARLENSIDNLNYSKKEDEVGFVSAVSQTGGQISATYKKVGVADLAEETFIFYCGNATGYADDMKTVDI